MMLHFLGIYRNLLVFYTKRIFVRFFRENTDSDHDKLCHNYHYHIAFIFKEIYLLIYVRKCNEPLTLVRFSKY